MKHNTYVAIIEKAEDGFNVRYPSFKTCFTCGETFNEAYYNAVEALGLHVYGLRYDGYKLPESDDYSVITSKLKKNEVAITINV